MIDKKEWEKVINKINQDYIVKIAKDIVNIHSPTGFEKDVAHYMRDRFQELGLDNWLQEVEPDRYNAVGRLRGTGGGATLLFDGHMDTSYTGFEEDMPDIPSYKPEAYIDDGWLCGLGIYNMKGALACYLGAINALVNSGVKVRGDVLVAAVVGEIEKSQVDQYQGQLYRGGACGTWYLITHGGLADYAVLGEPSGMRIMEAHAGYVWTKIKLTGMPAHSVFGDAKRNLIVSMSKIIDGLHSWGQEYEQKHRWGERGSTVTMSAIEGGWAYRASRVPIGVTLYVDIRVLPDRHPIHVQRDLEAAVADILNKDPILKELNPTIHVYASQFPSRIERDHPLFHSVAAGHRAVFGEDPKVYNETVFNDNAELWRHGIPACTYGPAGRVRTWGEDDEPLWDPMAGEQCNIEDLVNCTKVYASIILDICNQDVPSNVM